jgi:hypothetical protein
MKTELLEGKISGKIGFLGVKKRHRGGERNLLGLVLLGPKLYVSNGIGLQIFEEFFDFQISRPYEIEVRVLFLAPLKFLIHFWKF